MQVLRPHTTADALRLLAEGGEDTTIIAGGTALMLMMRNGLVTPERLVSLDRLSELDHVTVEPDAVRLGALVDLRRIERSAELATVLPTLTAAVGLVANHRIRQRATIGGCVSEADYASDPPAVLTTLGCQVHVVGAGSERWIPISEFILDYYQTALQPGEIVTEIRIPRPSATARTTYLKYISRSAEDRPCIGVAAHVELDASGRCTDVRVAVAGATPTPFTVTEATEALRGAKPDKTAWDEVGAAYSAAISPIGDARGSADYRKHVTGELVRRALQVISSGAENGAFRL